MNPNITYPSKGHIDVDNFPHVIQNLEQDCENLIQIMKEKYPTVQTNICVFSKNLELGERIGKMNNSHVVYLPTTYSMYFWEMDETTRQKAVTEIGLLYENFVKQLPNRSHARMGV